MKSLQLHKPYLLVVVGIPGAGKTFFAEQFAATFTAPFINYDDLYGMFEHPADAEVAAVYTLERLLPTKATIVIDGIGSSRSSRQEIYELGAKHGYETLFIWIQTDPVVAQSRAAKRTLAPLDKHTFTEESKRFELFAKNEPYMVISGRHTYATQAKVVLKRLSKPRTQTTSLTPPVRKSQPAAKAVKPNGRITIS